MLKQNIKYGAQNTDKRLYVRFYLLAVLFLFFVFVFCFFSLLKIECEIADKQLEKLEQIAVLPMSSAESKTIKPLFATMDNLLREWISADKDVKGDTYALKKMMVQFSFLFYFYLLAHTHRINSVFFFICAHEWKCMLRTHIVCVCVCVYVSVHV